MKNRNIHIKGPTKAAIIISYLPIETSKIVLSHLSTKEREEIVKEISFMQNYNPNDVEDVIGNFIYIVAKGRVQSIKDVNDLSNLVLNNIDLTTKYLVDLIKQLN